jgi:hypothetical protein
MRLPIYLASLVAFIGASLGGAPTALSDGRRIITRKAVVVGIDRYRATPERALEPLRGAVTDARGMADLLKQSFGFDDVRLVLDQDATRARILSAIRDLAKDARPGDVRTFFFSGHGGRVSNDASPEPDKLDETIVPIDWATGGGDLRDKELAREFNAVVDRGVVLTVILDSCHSGSAVRGVAEVPKGARAKSAGLDPRRVSDPAIPSPPEVRGALILSAAQDVEQAVELDTPKPHGALTGALLDTLKEAGATAEPAYRIFLRVKGAMKRDVRQNPVLAGTQQRQRTTLFDASPATVLTKTEVSVSYHDGEYVVEAGFDLGLGVGSLVGKRDAKGVYAKLEVTQLDGVSSAKARFREGDAQLAANGGRFEVLEWSAIPGTNLLVDLGDLASSDEELNRARADLEAVKAIPGVEWAADPTGWTHWLEWERTARGPTWVLYGPDGARPLTPQELRAWRPPAGKKARLFGVLPPARSVVEVLRDRWKKPGGWVTVSASRAEAHYRLIGGLAASGPAYCLVRAPDKAVGPLASLPAWTDRQPIAESQGGSKAAAAALAEAADRLARAYAWLVLRSPAAYDGTFPYRLALRRKEDGQLKRNGDVVTAGETYGLALIADREALDRVQPRWVYIFAMDSYGKRQLVFPRVTSGDVENRVPGGQKVPAEVVLTQATFSVSPPFGRDSFFLLATENKLPDPEALNEDGVRTRGWTPGAGGDVLPIDLLMPVTQRTRGIAMPPQPAEWTLQRIEVTSAGAKK